MENKHYLLVAAIIVLLVGITWGIATNEPAETPVPEPEPEPEPEPVFEALKTEALLAAYVEGYFGVSCNHTLLSTIEDELIADEFGYYGARSVSTKELPEPLVPGTGVGVNIIHWKAKLDPNNGYVYVHQCSDDYNDGQCPKDSDGLVINFYHWYNENPNYAVYQALELPNERIAGYSVETLCIEMDAPFPEDW